MAEDGGTAIVVGVGPGLGAALGRRFAAAGMTVALAARRRERVEPLAAETGAAAYACDATREADVAALFAAVRRDLGEPDLVVFNASGRVRKPLIDIGVAELEAAWRGACLGGFIVGREAARAMLPRGRGTILFTGATASVKGYAGSAGFAIGKFGLRGLAQSMARELGPQGIHVAHVIVDGGILPHRRAAGEEPDDLRLDPDAIAETYWHLHRQHRSAWAQEIDLRPWAERF
ncbi:MAG: SDR family NAD(P)-dependent oxidoreductase [Alphaproteobacteria bacterium]